jgi:hypothetical protein
MWLLTERILLGNSTVLKPSTKPFRMDFVVEPVAILPPSMVHWSTFLKVCTRLKDIWILTIASNFVAVIFALG